VRVTVEVDLLGTLAVRPGDVPAGPRLRALLVHLALSGGRVVDVADLARELWGAEPPADEAGALQSLVSRLRRALGGADTVQQVGSGYRLPLDEQSVDALRAERRVEDARGALRRGDADGAERLLAGPLQVLREQPVAEVPASVALRLRSAWRTAVLTAAEADLHRVRSVQALEDLQAVCDQQPLDEAAASLLVRALAAAGRPALALAAYDRLRRGLADELGLDPSRELQQQQLELLRGEPADGHPEHTRPLRSWWTSFVGRDADLDRVERLLQAGRLVTVLGPGGAGKTRLAGEVAQRQAHRKGLPPPAPAVEVCFVELAPVSEPDEVPQAVLSALDLRATSLLEARSGRPARDRSELLLAAFTGRESLLVLDNCEHLLDATAQLAEDLLVHCPGLRVLATSREPLGIDGEALAVLPPLPVPATGVSVLEAEQLPAVQLLVDRAAAVQPGFALDEDNVAAVVEVVRRLDGLPLAIELAAARLRTLPVGEVAARLADRFRLLTGGSRTALPRHRTLRAVVAWSWDLLTARERLLVERVAIFVGAVTPDSAAAVCGDSLLPVQEVRELLAALVDKSLLQRVEGATPRYRLLETIREFGTERLAERGELADLRDRHAAWFAGLAADADQRLRGAGQVAALDLLRAEHDDLLAALRHLCDSGRSEDALRLALSLAWYWQLLGRHAESHTWLRTALDLPHRRDLTGPGGPGDPTLRLSAEAVCALNAVSSTDGEVRDSAALRPRLVELAQQLRGRHLPTPVAALAVPIVLFFAGDVQGSVDELPRLVTGSDPWLAAAALLLRVRVWENEGALDAVRSDAEAALAAFRSLADLWGIASCLTLVAAGRQYDGDLDGALRALLEAEQCLRTLGQLDAMDELFLLLRLADLHLRRGNVGDARRAEAAAQRTADRSGSRELTAMAAALGGALARGWGDHGLARQRQHAADQTLLLVGVPVNEHGAAVTEAAGAALDLHEGATESAARRLQLAYEQAIRTADLPIQAEVGVVVAGLALAVGRAEEAARVLGGSARLRGADDPTHLDVRAVTAACRARLGEVGFAQAFQEGKALDIAQAQQRLDPARLLQDMPAVDVGSAASP